MKAPQNLTDNAPMVGAERRYLSVRYDSMHHGCIKQLQLNFEFKLVKYQVSRNPRFKISSHARSVNPKLNASRGPLLQVMAGWYEPAGEA